MLRTGPWEILSDLGVAWKDRNFEDIYDELYKANPGSNALRVLETRIREFFNRLTLPDGPTAYDYLLLSLRDKDLIASFNWDPFLLQAYQRHTPLRRLPHIVFLHGNVAVGVCDTCRVKGYVGTSCGVCGTPLTPSRLLFPISNKDYTSDPFIAAEWQELKQFLRYAYILMIFGYSAPHTDAAAVEVLKETWEENETRALAEVEVINVRDESEVFAAWSPFITRHHWIYCSDIRDSYLAWHPRRSCEALAFATLQNDPWPDDWMPREGTLVDLVEWVRPLLEEEELLEAERRPLSGMGRRAR
jgi:hypothetical protein